MHNGPPEHCFQQTEIWARIYLRQRPVGFTKTISNTVLYSRDGYGWSGTPIPYDSLRPQIPLPLANQRIFHGDVVQMPPHSGAQKLSEQVLLLTSSDQVLSYTPETDRIQPLGDLWPPPSTPRVRSIIGALEANSEVLLRAEDRLGNAELNPAAYALQLLLLSGTILGTLGASAGLQWWALGSIGPVFSLIGAILGGILFWAIARSRDWNALRRHTVLKMGAHTGLLLLVLGCLIATRMTAGGEAQLTDPSRALFVAYGGLGFFFGLISAWVGGELVAWRTGGFADEQSEDLGFRHSG